MRRLLPLFLVACSSSATVTGAPPSGDDAAVGEPSDAGGEAGARPTGKPTSLDATLGGVSRTLDRAQFGNDVGDAGSLVRVEVHAGGDPACPTEMSPTPDRTLVVANVPRAPAGSSFTHADGVRVSYFDFAGDQIPSVPIARASSATVTIAYADEMLVEVDVEATFPEGTVTGHATAQFCASLSSP